jgi:hypothetical protein
LTRPRGFRFILFGTLGVLATAAAAGGGFLLLRPLAESAARARLEGEARRRGLSLTLGSLRLSPRLSLELGDLVLEGAGPVRLSTRSAVLSPRLSLRGLLGRAARLDAAATAVELPAGLRLELAPSSWVAEARPPALLLRRLQPGQQLQLELTRAKGTLALRARARGARLSGFLRLLRHGCPLGDPGTLDGEASLEKDAAGVVHLALRGRARDVAIASWTTDGGSSCRDAELGLPTDVSLETDVVVQAARGFARADSFHLTAGGAEARGRFSIERGAAGPRLDAELDLPRLDFARLLATAGLDLPAEQLGSAALSARAAGPLLEPAALVVTQRLDFTPPARPLPAIERLKGPFVHRVETASGQALAIDVSPASPDFIALEEVPPLFLRALLIGEDANFYGHPGIDLGETAVALATDLARGTAARGASTISQQLAKNLFLSRRKTIGRKLQEASLALLLDSALGKSRVLEIYLNVIEWGPGLYGLRPAARHYFGVEPQALTPKQMVFLVSLIPGPVKYQRSIAGGTPTPFFEGLMATLLAKLASVGALSEAEYAAAVAEPLALGGPGDSPAGIE